MFALLDDVAALVKLTASSLDDIAAGAGPASVKAAGVVVDDAAVTPRYVQGLKQERELSIIWRIAKGSVRNKLLIILPVALILSQFAPFLLTPLLMVGGTHLCYEGAEKLWEKFSGHEAQAQESGGATAADAAAHEKRVILSAIRTDFILSAEIMVIALNEVAGEGLVARAIILLIVALVITALVYGVVALIVKMDDAGLALAARPGRTVAGLGRGLVKAMLIVLSTLSWVGVVAMLWVGGHILLVGADELGRHAPYELVHHIEVAVHDATGGLGRRSAGSPTRSSRPNGNRWITLTTTAPPMSPSTAASTAMTPAGPEIMTGRPRIPVRPTVPYASETPANGVTGARRG